jgi:hypothetical protein
MFEKYEIVKVRRLEQTPDYWSKAMESLRGEIVEVFSVNREEKTIIAGQDRNRKFIWGANDLGKYPLQTGCTVNIHPYKVDEGNFSEQKLDVSNLRGKRFEVVDVRPDLKLPIALNIHNKAIWVNESDLDFASIRVGGKTALDPNICFLSKKTNERKKCYLSELNDELQAASQKLKKAKFAEMYGEITAERSKPLPSETIKKKKKAMISESGTESEKTYFRPDAEIVRMNGPQETLRGLEENLAEKEKRDPYEPLDDDIPF